MLSVGLVLVVFPLSGAYRSWRGDLHLAAMGHTLPGLVMVAVMLTIAGTLTKTTAEFSRLWMGYWFIYAIVSLFLFRICAGWLLQRFSLGHLQPRKVVIVGAGEFAREVARRALEDTDARWQVAAYVRTNGASEALESGTTPLVTLQAMDEMIARPDTDVDEVWIAMTDEESQHRQEVIHLLQGSCLTVRYIPDLSVMALINQVPSEVAGMTAIDLNATPLSGANQIIKTLFDKLFAAAALLGLSPLLLLVAIAVKLDSPGPVYYRQKRHGWDRRVIEILKFRTMVRDSGEFRQASREDPRVTRLGRWLRRYSIDELPQFYNVLRGDMSVVGPRPHPVSLNDSYTDRIHVYMQRHRVRPGITGWAQVNGLRGETETLAQMQARIDYDLHYIQHWSMWLDVKIILLTMLRGWTGHNAF